MNLFSQVMVYFPYVFHPITVLGVGVVLLVHYEWARGDADRDELYRHVGAFLGAGVLGLVPTVAYFTITGSNVVESTQGNTWQMDALVASGVLIAAALTWWVWTRHDWGTYVPGAMEALTAVTIPYAAISPFWNISGHVIIALMPALYLTFVDQKFWPFMAVPIVMMPNRVYLGAHSVAQSVGGFLLAAVIVTAVYWLQAEQPEPRVPESVAR